MDNITRNKMFAILNELDKERKENKGVKFERILKYYMPLFVEYGSLPLKNLIEYENKYKLCFEQKNPILLCSISSTFLWYETNFYRLANNLPSLEEINEHEEIDFPFKTN